MTILLSPPPRGPVPASASDPVAAHPLYTQVAARKRAFGGRAVRVTTITRIWADGDAEACALCRVCTAQDGPVGLDRDGTPCRLKICTVDAVGVVALDSAALFSALG